MSNGFCVVCGRQRAAARRAAKPDATKAALAAWYQKNKDYAKACAKTWRQANLEKDAQNKRAWHVANPETVRASRAAWKAANPEKVKAGIDNWARAHPEIVSEQSRARCAKRRARKRSAGGTITATEIKEISKAQGNRCAMCKAHVKLTIDHIVPLALGGQHVRKNIQMLCLPCNSSKGAKHPVEFAQSRGLLL